MIRPRTTSHVAALLAASPKAEMAATITSPWQEAIAPIVEALMAVVAAVERQPADGPAWKAFQSAIRRKEEEAAAAGGSAAMEAVLRAVADGAPDRAERRESIISAAWTGLPRWRSGR
ncbi:hypothetical protein MKK64_08410 [Methylobacterium sp. E-025]|uniref:hypothetical protein n=1 Tax=Methylobacterium sp. E-025 TaxID=2836561 RepID=UPI001FBA9026|nr:hypothetical protein [Methylobacterium sp. E-025]MCJ2111212.1 hypothetical protein [Methylobacterium sp. E-025]